MILNGILNQDDSNNLWLRGRRQNVLGQFSGFWQLRFYHLLGHMVIVCDMSTVIYSYVLFEFDSCKIRVTPQYNIFCLLDS